jgi:hypothetical protein
MSKRLQVVIRDEELRRFSNTAESAGLTLSEWARQALREAERSQSSGDVEAKLATIDRAVNVQRSGREVDIDVMLAETQTGRLGG